MNRLSMTVLLLVAMVAALPVAAGLRAQGDELTYKAYAPMVASDSAPGETTSFSVYFFMESLETGQPGPYLLPVYREAPHTLAVARAAVEALIAGPTTDEASAVPAITTNVPADTDLLDISISGGVATVDLSAEFEAGGGSAAMLGRLAQLTYTVTQFPAVESVLLMIEGEVVDEFSSEGIILDGPMVREDFLDFLPPVFVDSPAYGAPAGNPLRAVGKANVFEATFQMVLYDNDGLPLAEETVTATCGTGCWGDFDVTIPYDVDMEQIGTLATWVLSAQDGEPEGIREYPVLLTPAE